MKPSALSTIAAGAWLAFALAGLWLDALVPLVGPLGLLLLVPAALDALLLLLQPRPRLSRTAPAMVNRQVPFLVTLRLEGGEGRRFVLFDGLPEGVSSPQLPISVPALKGHRRQKAAAGPVEISYRATASLRGDHAIAACHCRWLSPLRLWWRLARLGPETAIRVFPPFLHHHEEGLALMAGREQAGALHAVRRRGLGAEFHQLREYRHGDALRHIDWKASGKLHRPVVREYQEEQNQEIVFLLDTGYRLHAGDAGQTHFDRALESLLLLAQVALRQGDAVGVMSFGPVQRWLAPAKGQSAMNLLLSRLYDLESQPLASSPSEALEALLARLRRRSLIVLLTNVREEDGAGIAPWLPRLIGRHLLLTLWLREEAVDRVLTPPYSDFEASLKAAAARLYLDSRLAMQHRWQSQGIMVIDTSPALMGAGLINKYWEIKRAGRL